MSRTFRVDPHRALRRALDALLGGTVDSVSEEPWASMTFSGRRHRFRIKLPERADRLAGIAEIEFDLPGHLVAEIVALDRSPDDEPETFVVEALTISVV